MPLPVVRTSKLLLTALFTLFASLSAQAQNSYHCPDFLIQDGGEAPRHKGELTLSPYTIHWRNSSEHKDVYLVALDEQLPGNRLCGVSAFTNSFGQPSVYVYAGKQYNDLLGSPRLFAKVTAGVLNGYVGKYKNKVPLNSHGFSPAIIPSLGYNFSPTDSAQVVLLGTAGIMFAYGHKF